MRVRMMFVVLAAAMAVLFAGCGGGSGSTALTGATGLTPATATVAVPATVNNGRFQAMVRLADLGLASDGRSEAEYRLRYVLTGSAPPQVDGEIPFVNGIATISEILPIGPWWVGMQVVRQLAGVDQLLYQGESQFTVVVNETVTVDITLYRVAPPVGGAIFNVTASEVSIDDRPGQTWISPTFELNSHDGRRLPRQGIHRFTWTPVGASGADQCRLYIDLLRYDSTGGDGLYTPADVHIVNFDGSTMGFLEVTNEYGGQTYRRITFVGAKPGITVELEISLTTWPPYQAADYNRIQFGRVDNINPPNYRVEGVLDIVD